MKRLLYIYNPNAGRQRSKFVLADILQQLNRQGYLLTVCPTSGTGNATQLAAAYGAEHDRVVCCGGDGTLNEVVAGLLTIPEEKRPVLGYIPMGSTNDFARSLGLPKNLAEQVATAGMGTGRPIDVGNSSGHTFSYVSAFGLFTEVSYSTPQNMKNVLGHFAYVLEGAGQLINVPSYHMSVWADGEQKAEGEYIYGMVGNTVSVGGVMNLPRDLVKLDDGKFEVLLIRNPRTPKDWQEILTALANLKVPCSGAVTSFSAKDIVFTCTSPVAWTVDGEFGGERKETTIKVLPKAMDIVY